jgi:hypothetical protein
MTYKVKRKYSRIAATSVVILLSFILISAYWPRRPFADLKQEDVLSADISFGVPPNYQITETDQKRVVELLQTITVTGKSYLYKSINSELSKKTYIELFILHLDTNETVSIQPCYPFIMINETVYHCKDRDALEEMIDIFNSYIDVIRQTTKPSGTYVPLIEKDMKDNVLEN